MYNHRKLKADHIVRCLLTEEDEKFYKEPLPLTEEQKLEMLHEVQEIKRKIAERDRLEELYKERYAEMNDQYPERLW